MLWATLSDPEPAATFKAGKTKRQGVPRDKIQETVICVPPSGLQGFKTHPAVASLPFGQS